MTELMKDMLHRIEELETKLAEITTERENRWDYVLASSGSGEYNLQLKVEAAADRIEALEEQILDLLVDLPCSCGHDNPTDVCMKHLPVLRKAQARISELEAQLDKITAEGDEQVAWVKELALDVIAAGGQASDAYDAQKKAEARVAELEARLAEVTAERGAYIVATGRHQSGKSAIYNAGVEFGEHKARAAIPRAYRMGLEAAADRMEANSGERCLKCSRPRNAHHVRHPFVGSDMQSTTPEAIRDIPTPTDLVEQVMKEVGQ